MVQAKNPGVPFVDNRIPSAQFDKAGKNNLVRAIDEAKRKGLRIYGVVGRDGGYTKQMGDAVLVIPTVNEERVTPHTEAFHAVAWHCLVSHPKLQLVENKWESTAQAARP